jgi:hypothetical protein
MGRAPPVFTAAVCSKCSSCLLCRAARSVSHSRRALRLSNGTVVLSAQLLAVLDSPRRRRGVAIPRCTSAWIWACWTSALGGAIWIAVVSGAVQLRNRTLPHRNGIFAGLLGQPRAGTAHPEARDRAGLTRKIGKCVQSGFRMPPAEQRVWMCWSITERSDVRPRTDLCRFPCRTRFGSSLLCRKGPVILAIKAFSVCRYEEEFYGMPGMNARV